MHFARICRVANVMKPYLECISLLQNPQ
jgi:hypothetical protein